MDRGVPRLERRDFLRLSTVGVGALAGAGSVAAAGPPPLEEAYFRVTGDGDIRFLLVFENEAEPADLPAVPFAIGDPPPIDFTGEESIDWGEPITTELSVEEYGEKLALDTETRLNLEEADSGTFNEPGSQSLRVVEERPEDIVSGRLEDVVDVPELAEEGLTSKSIDLPAIRYVGGPIGLAGTLSNTTHLQLPDGFVYDLPPSGVSGGWGLLSGDKLGFPSVPQFEAMEDDEALLVPAFTHRVTVAISGIRSSAGSRARAYRGIAGWAQDQALEEYTNAVRDWATTTVSETLGLLGGPPSEGDFVGGAIFGLSNFALPVAGPVIARGLAGAASVTLRQLQLGDALGDMVGTVGDARSVSTLYDRIQFDEDPPVEAAEATVLSEPLREATQNSASAENVSQHAQFVAGEAIQVLTAAEESRLPTIIDAYRGILDTQESEIRTHEAILSNQDPFDADVTETKNDTVDLLNGLLDQIQTERELLREFERTHTDVVIQVSPDPPGAGEVSTLGILASDGRPISATDISIDRTEWTITRVADDADPGNDAGVPRNIGPSVDELSGGTEVDYTFDNPGTYTISVDVFLQNHGEPIRTSVTVDAIREVTANIDVPEALPADEVVELDASNSFARTTTTIETYEWDIEEAVEFEEAIEELSANEDPPFYTGSETLFGETVDFVFDDGQYRISLTVTDDQGNSATTSVERVAGVGMDPAIEVGSEPPYRVGESIEFTADVATPGGQVIDSYEWQAKPRFGAPEELTQEATGDTVTFSFDETGRNFVALVVADTDGVTAYTTTTVFVEAPPPDDDDGPDDTASIRIEGDPPGETDAFWVGEPVRFDLQYDPAGTTVQSVEWEFLESGFDPDVLATATGQSTTVRFDQSEKYAIRASVATADGSGFVVESRLATDFDVHAVRLDAAADLDNDGLREDVNGNGRIDFGDVVTFQRAVDSPKNPVLIPSDTRGPFAFAGGGGTELIGQDDVDALYELVKERVTEEADE